MKNSFYMGLMLGVVALSSVAYATGVPVRGRGEIINMITDKDRSNDDHMIVKTHAKVMDEVIDITGGPESFSSSNAQEVLAETLIPVTDALTEEKRSFTKEVQEDMGEKLKPCGRNAEKFMKQIESDMAYPATQKEREKLSEQNIATLTTARKTALENSATAGLARAWIAEREASDVAESFAILPDELSNDNMDSEMDAMVQILRLQEETFKNMNTRTSLMADELKNTGLAALEGNM